jgi:hypothetical protein
VIYAISSACPEVVIQPEWCEALAKQRARLAKWHGHEPNRIEFTTAIGQIDDPDAVDVQILPDLSRFPGTSGLLAFHDYTSGRPVCYMGAAAIKAENGTDNWILGPNGLWSAVSHEICETDEDRDCAKTVTNPDGQVEPYEVCDRLQGSDYEEDGSPGIWLANALGPQGFVIGAARAAGLDIASDLRTSTFTASFPLTPGGYYAPEGEPPVFGERVSGVARARIERHGARGGMRRRRATTAPELEAK